jgi:predicted transcriptional regulator of viral defense system
VVGGVRYEFVTTKERRFFGVDQVWVNERNRVPIFDCERALLDAFHHFQVFGSLSTALEILEDHIEEIDVVRLVRYAARLEVGAVTKRVGWALERFGVPAQRLEPLRASLSKGDTPLDPGLPRLGRHNSRWRVIENLAVRDAR